MPSKSKKQAKLMRAVAHGWKPSRIKGPTRTVAKEFVSADKRRDEVNGYNHGGYNRGGEMNYDEYQFGGGVPSGMYGNTMNRFGGQYRGVPPQRGGIQQGPTGMMAGRPGMFGSGWGARQPGRGGGMPGRGPAGALQQYTQSGGGGGIMDRIGMGGGRFGSEMRRARGQQTYQDVVNRGGGGINPMMESGQRMYGRPPTPGIHDLQDMSMGEGPGGRLEQESIRRQAKMRGPGRFPGAGGPGPDPHQGRTGPGGMGGRMSQAQNRFGALTQGAPGGGSFGKPRPSVPGRRIAPPPSYPGGGNPNTRGRNPMMRASRNRRGRGATSFLR